MVAILSMGRWARQCRPCLIPHWQSCSHQVQTVKQSTASNDMVIQGQAWLIFWPHLVCVRTNKYLHMFGNPLRNRSPFFVRAIYQFLQCISNIDTAILLSQKDQGDIDYRVFFMVMDKLLYIFH